LYVKTLIFSDMRGPQDRLVNMTIKLDC